MLWSFIRSRPPGVTLTGPRVVLRAPVGRDAAQWMSLREKSRDFLKSWEPTWPPDSCSRAAFERRRLQIKAEWRSGVGCGFLIFDRSEGFLVGGITLSNVRQGVAATGSLGYWIGAAHAQKGYMTESVGCIVDYAFRELHLHRVEAACLPHNEASRGLLAKCGFQEEGLARGYLKIDGRWRDHVLFGLLREDDRPGF